ncbi:hypothetical protein MCERE19_01623 [Spirosomataceae bacterium]|jgi:hypothetical protein
MFLLKAINENKYFINNLSYLKQYSGFFLLLQGENYKINYYLYNLKDASFRYKIINQGVFRGIVNDFYIFENNIEGKEDKKLMTFFKDSTFVKNYEIEGSYFKQIDNEYFIKETLQGKGNKITYFNIQNNQKFWEIESEVRLKYILNVTKEIFLFSKGYEVVLLKNEHTKFCINLLSYFAPSPQWANGEPMFRQTISKVLYCQTFNTIICFLKPNKIVGINSEKGVVVWEQKFIINTDNFVIDNETGMIYALEAVWDNKKDRRTILYQVINCGNGEIEFERDLYEELNGEIEPFNVHIHFAGYYEDAIYFSLYERGELYKVSKFSANILEKYKHDKAFYGSPEIFNNRLFVAEDDEKMKRLLVFEI